MAQQIKDDAKFTGVRLPKTIVPVKYELSLKPNLKDFTFEGNVKISYETHGTVSNNVVLHSKEQVIKSGQVHSGAQKSELKTVTYSEKSETATLEFDSPIPPNGYISLEFSGILNDKLRGFYRTTFEVDGATVNAATSQLESTFARLCFPCWDEPSCKAVFSVSITYDRKYVADNGKEFTNIALSNMPLVSENEVGPGKLEAKFADTPIMSTYLLAMIVGPFDFIEASDGKRPVRVFTTPGKKEQGQFALDVACKSLRYYEDYFNIEYPLPKMDLIAIPDFAAGAMENWGLVTYRETCILVDPSNTSTACKQYVALVVAHELAHQWFGNLVTMEWWTHLWLNEGFATFMEFLCIDQILPEYDIWSQFVSQSYSGALSLDSLHNSHPIEVEVKNSAEVDEIFDQISYEKGASVIRMLHEYIGDEAFRKGMHKYLSNFAYKNAATEHLWTYLGEASQKPVNQVMSGWTLTKGYPWISVSAANEGGKAKLTLTQSQFTADGQLVGDEVNAKWMIPISTITESEPLKAKNSGLLSDKTGTFEVDAPSNEWIKLNPRTVGIYRTAYPEDLKSKLTQAVSSKALSPMDRFDLQDDYYALCEAGKVPTVDYLKLLQAYRDEDNFTVWSSIDSSVSSIAGLLAGTKSESKFDQFVQKLYSKILQELTWTVKPNEKHTDAMTRPLVINRLVTSGDKAVVAEALERFRAHVSNKAVIPADLRGPCFKAAACYGTDEDYEHLFSIFKSAELHEEKRRVLRVLGCSKDLARLKKAVAFALTDQVRIQDKFFVMMPIGSTNPSFAWETFKANKDFLLEKYDRGHIMGYLIKSAAGHFKSLEKADEVAKWFADNNFPGNERTLQQTLETIKLNAAWLARDGDNIDSYLSSQ